MNIVEIAWMWLNSNVGAMTAIVRLGRPSSAIATR